MNVDAFFRWQFKTDGFDIGFGVFKKIHEKSQKASEMEVVLDSQRVNSHMVPEDGMLTVAEPGHCEFEFWLVDPCSLK